jgi:chromosome segregation ATPase
MSDFLKKVRSVFIVDEQPAETPAPAAPAPAAPVQSTPAAGGLPDNKFLEALASALERSNQEGFDYLEFRQALKNLSGMNLDEQTAFRSAFGTASTMGITPARLLESTQYYLQVLSGEKQKFDEAHEQQRARLIGNREAEAQSLEKMIQEKNEQIARLSREIEEHQAKKAEIAAEITESTQKIETTRASFESGYAAVTEQISQDAVKIRQYLQ